MADDGKAQRGDELFDLVDAQDRVIGQATRDEVHADALWHRAIHVLVCNRTGQVFLQKRSMLKDMAPGCWDSSCSGHLDAGEQYDDAAVRELGEELGLRDVTRPVRLLYLKASPPTGWEFVWSYRLEHEGPFELHPAEIEKGEWWEPARIDASIEHQPDAFAPAFRHLWKLLRQRAMIPGPVGRAD